MFNPKIYENSRSDGIGVLEIVNGTELQKDRAHQFVPLKRTELRGEITGPLASLCLTHIYGYSREQCDKVLEAVYRFPLPGDAAVTAVRVRFGDVEIRAELKERQEAEADYEEAKRKGRQAALLSRESPDVFTLHVAGIEPDQDVAVETSYVQLARTEGPGWSLRVSLTTAPRYVRSDEFTSRHAQGQPLLLLRDPDHRFSLDLHLFGAGVVKSGTHQLDVMKEGNRMRIRLRDGEVIPDRDFILSWQPQQNQDRPILHVWLHDDQASEQVYFLALVAPPAVHDTRHGIPRDVILLVDHSGSMTGAKWEAADWAVKKFLYGLTEQDSFGLGLFHNTTRWFSKTFRKADSDVVEKAVRFLEKHQDSGGTELGVAIEQALDLERAKGEYARHVLIITDAQVTDEGRILRLADQESKREDRRRISVLCIDAAPNSFLAVELAERGGGKAKFLTSSPEEEDISTALDEILADWAQPVLTKLRLEINRQEVQAAGPEVFGGGEVGYSLIDLGDLPAGRSIWVAGRVVRGEMADLAFRVTAAENWEVAACRLNLAKETSKRPALKALFGARQILGLEYLIHSGYTGKNLVDQLKRLGYDPQKVLGDPTGKPPRVYAENVRRDSEKALRDLLAREAMDYGLVSSETAFIAVRAEKGKPIEQTLVVANALPAGWSEEFLSGSPMIHNASMVTTPAFRRKIPRTISAPSAPAAQFKAKSRALIAFMEPSEVAFVAQAEVKTSVLFSDVPLFEGSESILFDSSRAEDASKVPDKATFSCLKVRFHGRVPKHGSIDPGLCLLIFVDDLSSPRAKVQLADLMRQGGERPLNLLRLPGQRVRIILVDLAGMWVTSAPQIHVVLEW